MTSYTEPNQEVIKITVEKFINLHSPIIGSEPWYNYCEAVIDENGEIYELKGSHEQLMLSMLTDEDKKTAEYKLFEESKGISVISYLCEWKHYISIWYNYIMIFKGALINSDIMKTINLLSINGLLDKDILSRIEIAHDMSTAMFMCGDMEEEEYFKLMDEIRVFNTHKGGAKNDGTASNYRSREGLCTISCG